MAIIIKDGIEFHVPDGRFYGRQLGAEAGVRDAFPVLHRGGKDIPIEPEEEVVLTPTDRVSYVTPMETAGDRY